VNVLKHNPVAFLVAHFEFVVRVLFLTLSEGDQPEGCLDIDSFLLAEFFDILDRVCTWRKDKVDWNGWR
jgi:hypothetical protein